MEDYRLLTGFTRSFIEPAPFLEAGDLQGARIRRRRRQRHRVVLRPRGDGRRRQNRLPTRPGSGGCPTTAMWVYRVGPEKAKRMLLTGDMVSGREAASMGLVLEAVPEDELDRRVGTLAARIAGVPRSQLMMQKLMVNQALESMGLSHTQMVATLFDGMARHSPVGVAWKERAEQVGFRQAVKERDSGEPIPERAGCAAGRLSTGASRPQSARALPDVDSAYRQCVDPQGRLPHPHRHALPVLPAHPDRPSRVPGCCPPSLPA